MSAVSEGEQAPKAYVSRRVAEKSGDSYALTGRGDPVAGQRVDRGDPQVIPRPRPSDGKVVRLPGRLAETGGIVMPAAMAAGAHSDDEKTDTDPILAAERAHL